MSTGLHGSDPQTLRDLAKEFECAQSTLLGVRSQLSARIHSQLKWEGPDAFVFRHAWQSSYSPVIRAAADMLAETATVLKSQASEQEAASS